MWFRGGEGAPANDERVVERMRASRPRARPYGERTLGVLYRESNSPSPQKQKPRFRAKQVLLALSGHAAAGATCLSALEEVSRDADEGVVEAGWSPGLDHPLVERKYCTHPHMDYFIQRKPDVGVEPRRARRSSFFLGLAAVSSTRRRARLGGSPLPRSVCSRRCLGCAAWSSLRTHRASGRPRTCTRTARR